MEWEIGQPIVAIKSTKGFKYNEDFIIKGIQPTCCNTTKSLLIELKNIKESVGDKTQTYCHICDKPLGGHWFDERNFAPLDVNIEELTNILTEPIVNKKFDLNNLFTL